MKHEHPRARLHGVITLKVGLNNDVIQPNLKLSYESVTRRWKKYEYNTLCRATVSFVTSEGSQAVLARPSGKGEQKVSR